MDRNSRLKTRREDKFRKHEVEIVEQASTEIRGQAPDQEELHFTHAIMRKDKLVGRAQSWRSALKRAHQVCKGLG